MMVKKMPAGAIDFHAHILPGMDHGSRDLSEAIVQWRLLSDLGVARVVATPHFYAQDEPSVDDFVARRDAAAQALRNAVSGTMRLSLGAEVLLFRGLDRMEGLDRLCIEGTNAILLEMPLGGFDSAEVETVERIAALGLCPVIAHIDRYLVDTLALLLGNDSVRFQVNAGAFLGLSRRAACLRRMAEDGVIAAIGSDLHGTDRRALRGFARAMARLGAGADMIFKRTATLLDGAAVC